MNDFVSLQHIYKVYPNGVEAVHDFCLDINKHEFVVIVGPSGCGKSTTLRMVAGLEDITDGKLFIDGDLSNEKTPKDRNIAMVFQSYSLYPHMTVFDNIAFGLKMRKYPFPKQDKEGKEVLEIDQVQIKRIENNTKSLQKELTEINRNIDLVNKEENLNEFLNKKQISLEERKAFLEGKISENCAKVDYLKQNPSPKMVYRHLNNKEISERVNDVASILELTDYLKRKPAELSGGQRQRVALGRAIIRDAKVFLMDEPLSNLDAKLRVTMRSEIIKLHEKLNATVIYVTHDQTEAMTMADRIVVMKDGYIQQIGTPSEIYQNPRSIFVANFIGAPAMNILKAEYDLNNVSLQNGLTIKMKKEQKDAFNKFYDKQIEKYQSLLDLLNTDVEEVAMSLFDTLKPFILQGFKNDKECAKSIIKHLGEPILESLKKINDSLRIALDRDDIDKEESRLLKETLGKDIQGFNSLYNKVSSLFEQKVELKEKLIPELQYYKISSNNQLVDEVIKRSKERFEAVLSLADKVLEYALESQPTGLLYALHMLECLKELVKLIKKNNQEDLLNHVSLLQDEIRFDVIKEDVEKAVKQLDKKLHHVLSLTDSDIRLLYYTALRVRGSNNNIDWILSLIDESIKSKKYENKLRNEYLIEVLINGLIDEFNNKKVSPHKLLFGIRPEDIYLNNKWNKEKCPTGLETELEVDIVELLGKEYILHLAIGEDDLLCQIPNELQVSLHDKLKLLFDDNKIHLFDPITEEAII